MSMIRADGDVIRAINAMTDLNDMVRRYVNIHRRVYNGFGNVNIPEGNYVLSFGKISEDKINVNLFVDVHYSTSRTVSEPTYDLGSGPGDLDGVLFYEDREHTEWHDTVRKTSFNLPYRFIFMEAGEIEKYLLDKKAEDQAKAKEEKRLKEIESLETRLKELKN
jgi:hypothetical protein